MAASKDLINSAYKKLTTRPISNAEWARIEKQARSRPLPDCAICLTPMHMGYTAIPGACDTGRASASPCPGHGHCRPTVLLSCTHVFHDACLTALEQYGIDVASTCPICRSQYTKMPFAFSVP